MTIKEAFENFYEETLKDAEFRVAETEKEIKKGVLPITVLDREKEHMFFIKKVLKHRITRFLQELRKE